MDAASFFILALRDYICSLEMIKPTYFWDGALLTFLILETILSSALSMSIMLSSLAVLTLGSLAVESLNIGWRTIDELTGGNDFSLSLVCSYRVYLDLYLYLSWCLLSFYSFYISVILFLTRTFKSG